MNKTKKEPKTIKELDKEFRTKLGGCNRLRVNAECHRAADQLLLEALEGAGMVETVKAYQEAVERKGGFFYS